MTFYEKQTDPSSPMHWKGNMQADYFYPNGVAGDRFFKHLMKNDTFLASKCPKCSKVFFPPRSYCEDCFVEIAEGDWIEVPTSGKVKLHTTVMIDTYGERFDSPKVVALIEIDNTDGSMLAMVDTDKIDKNLCGAHVEAVLRSKDKREGTLKDILYFKEK
jgi:uncharacterized OB-fold protein